MAKKLVCAWKHARIIKYYDLKDNICFTKEGKIILVTIINNFNVRQGHKYFLKKTSPSH